jgi:hypothetical protein
MPSVRFELTTPVFKRPKKVHALDREIMVIGLPRVYCSYFRVLTVGVNCQTASVTFVHTVKYSIGLTALQLC